MFAIVKTGGKQYRVQENSIIRVEKLLAQAGEAVCLDKVLMVGAPNSIRLGSPFLEGAKVEATVMSQIKDKKVIIFKKKKRHNYRRKKGHRQQLTVLKITSISSN